MSEVDVELHRLSTVAPWNQYVPYLMQMPGFGIIVVMTVLAAIGDITRFPTAKKLVGYAGLGASVHASGETYRTGHITKTGRKDLRWIMVEAARIAVIYHEHWKREYAALEKRLGTNKAVVVIARKLLVVVWHVLTDRVADRNVDAERIAYKLMAWSWKLDDAQRGGLTTPQFVRYQLMQLKIGNELTQVQRGKDHVRTLATVEEILALHPELKTTA